jgi:hypothetical protein
MGFFGHLLFLCLSLTSSRINLMSKESCLDQRTRAEDIILGSLGFGEEARISSIQRVGSGFKGVGIWNDGQTFEFESEDELTHLENWALDVLAMKGAKAA